MNEISVRRCLRLREASDRELNVQIERLTRAVRAVRGNMIAVQHFPNHGVPTHSVAVTFRIPLESSLSFDDKLAKADIHSQSITNADVRGGGG